MLTIEKTTDASSLPFALKGRLDTSTVQADDAVLHLGSQIVSGLNHCVLAKGWNLVFVHADLEGKTQDTQTVPLDVAALSQPSEQ